jgi:hypothetical protein
MVAKIVLWFLHRENKANGAHFFQKPDPILILLGTLEQNCVTP